MSDDFAFTNFNELDKALLQLVRDTLPEALEQKIKEIAWRLFADIKRITPVAPKHGGTLRDSLVVGNLVRTPEGLHIEVGFGADYAIHVEYGHRIFDKSGQVVGFVQGRHMMTVSLKKMADELPSHLNAWLREVTKEFQ